MTTTPSRRISVAPIAAAVLTTAGAAAAIVGFTGFGRDARGLPTAIGASRSQIREAAERSPHFTDEAFHNTEPSHVISPSEGLSMIPRLIAHRGAGKPAGPVPLIDTPPAATAAELGITWLGHATTLIEIDGQYVLTDPVWSDRVSPAAVGPARLHPMPITVDDLPRSRPRHLT